MRSTFILLTALLLPGMPATAQGNWGPDSSFGVNGKVVAQLTPSVVQNAGAVFSLTQPDGKIIVSGHTYDNRHVVLMRFHLDGSPDSSFGTAGVVETGAGPWNSLSDATAMALQPDGKMVVGGSIFNPTNLPAPDNDFLLLRYNADGSPDATFGSGGQVITNVNQQENNTVSVVLQPDGKILLGGTSFTSTAILRYNTDGSPDGTFGSGGLVLLQLSSNNFSSVAALALQPDGKIVGGGYRTDSTGEGNFVLVRFNSNGSPDPGFGTGGISTIQAGSTFEIITAVLIQPDGKIVGGGWGTGSSNYEDSRLVRCLPNGAPDSSFGINGLVVNSLSNEGDMIRSIVLQPDGKIITTGDYYTGATLAAVDYDFVVARYLGNGTPDSSFGSAGRITTDFDSKYDIAKHASLQADGNIILVGESGEHPSFALARYAPVSVLSVRNDEAVAGCMLAYPNPLAGDRLTLAYELREAGPVTVRITDLSGTCISPLIREQARRKGRHEEILTLPEGLAPGIYLLQVCSRNGTAGISILKQ